MCSLWALLGGPLGHYLSTLYLGPCGHYMGRCCCRDSFLLLGHYLGTSWALIGHSLGTTWRRLGIPMIPLFSIQRDRLQKFYHLPLFGPDFHNFDTVWIMFHDQYRVLHLKLKTTIKVDCLERANEKNKSILTLSTMILFWIGLSQ